MFQLFFKFSGQKFKHRSNVFSSFKTCATTSNEKSSSEIPSPPKAPIIRQKLHWAALAKAQIDFDTYSALEDFEKIIYIKHLTAVKQKQLSYKDPETGFEVLTALQLLLNENCCGNACRHCPYEWKNVTPEKRKRRWNGAFYS